MSKTGDQLIADVGITVTLPNNQVLITNQRMLALANEEIMAHIEPLILSLNQEYFVRLDESQFTVDGQAEYPIPYRAIGRILRDLKIRDVPGSGNIYGNVFNCDQIQLEDANTLEYVANRFCYYFRGDKIHLVPIPRADSYQLLRYYLLRPNQITTTDAAGKVMSISGNIVTLNIVPDTFLPGTFVDFIEGVQGNSTIEMDQMVTNVSGTQVTITDVPPTLSPGDWVSIAEQSPVLQLPDECFPLLVYLTAKRCLYAIGDYDGMKAIDDQIPEKRTLVEKMLAPRNQGETVKINNRNGLLRGRRLGFWRGVIR